MKAVLDRDPSGGKDVQKIFMLNKTWEFESMPYRTFASETGAHASQVLVNQATWTQN